MMHGQTQIKFLLTYLYYSVLAVFMNKLIYRLVYFPSDTYFNASSD